MNTAIERLRASRAESLKRDELEGKANGRSWAENHARYDDLRRLSELTQDSINCDPFGALTAAINPDKEMGPQEFKEHCFDDPNANVSEVYIAAFIEGAVDFFEEVADKL